MPMYEYQCAECESRFELLRPTKEASVGQPCPSCDADSKRVMSKQWSAFVFRDGRPRQLPDDGGYLHLGQKVSQPITGPTNGVDHPELKKQAPPKPLSIEEMERYEYSKERETNRALSSGVDTLDQRSVSEERSITRRMRLPGTAREQTVKRRVAGNAYELEYKKLTAP